MILAMDLSLSSPAFAIGTITDGMVDIKSVSHVKTTSKYPHGQRLKSILQHMEDLYDRYPITDVVREKGFSRHAVTTQALFKVVGVSDVTAYHFGHEKIHEIPPTTVKKLLTGNGKASKEEVMEATKKYLAHPMTYANDDESDAVAVLIAYAMGKRLLE